MPKLPLSPPLFITPWLRAYGPFGSREVPNFLDGLNRRNHPITSERWDSNPRPTRWQRVALPTELRSRSPRLDQLLVVVVEVEAVSGSFSTDWTCKVSAYSYSDITNDA